MKPVAPGEPDAGILPVRFDEGAGVPHGASRSTLHPSRSSKEAPPAKRPHEQFCAYGMLNSSTMYGLRMTIQPLNDDYAHEQPIRRG